MTDQSRARMAEILAERRYAAALDAAAKELSSFGVVVARTNAMTKEAVQAALDAAERQDRFHLVWHRVWGVRLRSEVIETAARLARLLDGEEASLVWGRSPRVGFTVSVASVLRALPEHVGPPGDEVGPRGAGSGLLLVSEDGRCGLRLDYNHHAHADEYEMRSWGRFAVPLTGQCRATTPISDSP